MNRWFILWLCVGIHLVFYITPDDTDPVTYVYPFPLAPDQAITWQAWVHTGLVYVSRAMFLLTLAAFVPQHQKSFFFLAIIEAFALANYFLRYGHNLVPGVDMMHVRWILWGILCAGNIYREYKPRYATK